MLSLFTEYHEIFRQYNIPDDQLANIISKVFTDHPSNPDLPYNFRSSNPSTNGQIGVPPIVDKILGNIQYGAIGPSVFNLIK